MSRHFPIEIILWRTSRFYIFLVKIYPFTSNTSFSANTKNGNDDSIENEVIFHLKVRLESAADFQASFQPDSHNPPCPDLHIFDHRFISFKIFSFEAVRLTNHFYAAFP